MKKGIIGVIAASVTPFTPDGAVDSVALRHHLDFMVRNGVDGVLVAATSGEFNSMSVDELREVYETAVEELHGRATVIAGIIELSSTRALQAAIAAKISGADALLVAPPFFVKPTREGIANYFEMLGDETGLPIVLYNNPGRVGWTMDPAMLEILLRSEHVVGIKDCERDLGLISEKIELFGSRLAVLSGDDDLGYPTLLCGAVGGIWAGPNLAPDIYASMFAASQSGDFERGRSLHLLIGSLCRAWFVTNHPGPLKSALALLGRPAGEARPPLGKTSQDVEIELVRAIDKAHERAVEILESSESLARS